jgi:hypothetical protein
VIGPSQRPLPAQTAQHRNTKTNIYASIGIQTHDHSNQAANTNALDRAATRTGIGDLLLIIYKKINKADYIVAVNRLSSLKLSHS